MLGDMGLPNDASAHPAADIPVQPVYPMADLPQPMPQHMMPPPMPHPMPHMMPHGMPPALPMLSAPMDIKPNIQKKSPGVRRKRSPVWDYFTLYEPTDAEGKNCKCTVKGLDGEPCDHRLKYAGTSNGTSNLLRHLR
jgi:hypothetical protein